jgi:DtxR family manganese transport transcriptional regulator
VRIKHAVEGAEDYCEAIADLLGASGEARVGELAKRFGLSHVTVSRVVAR